MKTTTRYSLIILGILVFLVLAPMLVLYVSGRKVNFSDRDTSATGILDAKSNPGGAKVKIDDKDQSTTPAIARFLLQGQYKISITKDGYYDWVKNLAIESGKVTYTQVGVDEVQLIKKSEPYNIVDKEVTSFALVNDIPWYTTNHALNKGALTKSTPESIIVLNFNPTSLIRLRDKSHLLATDSKTNFQIINTANSENIVLPTKYSQINDVNVSSNNIVIFRSKNSLISFNPSTKTETPLRSDLIAFTLLENTGYFASTSGVISSAVWNGTSFVDEQNITSEIPVNKTDQAQLIISDKKVLFYKNNNHDLFRVGKTLEPILNQVDTATLNLDTDELAIRTSSELWFYNFISNQAQLLTRNTVPANDYMIHSAIGYGFIANANGLEAIEIDNRDKQNRYDLLKDTSKPVWQITMTTNQKTIIALQDGVLISLEIRN